MDTPPISSRRNGVSPDDADEFVSIDTTWCPGCRRECTVEIVQLPGDPQPVVVCLDCGGGVEPWWDAAVGVRVEVAIPTPRRARAS